MPVSFGSMILFATTLLLSPALQATQPTPVNQAGPITQGDLTDAWLKGKVEMALLLNRYLNGFKISTSVKDRRVTLSGNVATQIDRDLAQQIVLGVDGIASVENRLEVRPPGIDDGADSGVDRSFQRIRDVTLTALVKSRLVLNRNISAISIDVATRDSVVTLKGTVQSDQQRALAIQVAKNTENVKSVRDELKVVPAS